MIPKVETISFVPIANTYFNWWVWDFGKTLALTGRTSRNKPHSPQPRPPPPPPPATWKPTFSVSVTLGETSSSRSYSKQDNFVTRVTTVNDIE